MLEKRGKNTPPHRGGGGWESFIWEPSRPCCKRYSQIPFTEGVVSYLSDASKPDMLKAFSLAAGKLDWREEEEKGREKRSQDISAMHITLTAVEVSAWTQPLRQAMECKGLGFAAGREQRNFDSS